MDNLEQELLARQEKEFEAQQQQERLARQQQQGGVLDTAKNLGKEYAKNVVKDAIKEEATAAATGFLASTAWIWGPILATIVGIFALIIIIIAVVGSACNQGGLKGTGIKALSYISSFITSTDVCAAFDLATTSTGNTAAVTTPQLPPPPIGARLDIVITSAYRPGAVTIDGKTSAHSRGEAVDIALRNPTVGIGSNDPRIIQLVNIGKSVGFIPPKGDTLNEYATPECSGSTCGGHVHVEFNTYTQTINGKTVTYSNCDDKPLPSDPNQLDLVPLASVGITVDAQASNPSVRACMLTRVTEIFRQAGVIQ